MAMNRQSQQSDSSLIPQDEAFESELMTCNCNMEEVGQITFANVVAARQAELSNCCTYKGFISL